MRLFLLSVTSVVLGMIVPHDAFAATYYVSPTGNDASAGTSTSAPWATFTKAWQVIQPGDTLYLMDGTYYQALYATKDGAPNPAINVNDYITYPLDHPDRIKNYIKIKALNDGKAIIDGQYQRNVVNLGHESNGYWNKGHYVLVEGLVGKNASGTVFWVANAKNVILRRNSGYNANPHVNYHVFSVYSGGDAITPANILLEDNVAAGSGRKMVLAFVTYHNLVFRRNFAAWQYWLGDEWCGSPWPQTDGIEIYPERQGDQPNIPNNTYLENNINFGLTANNGVGFSPNTGKRYGNHILGNMALGAGMRWNNSLKLFEAKKFDGSPLIDISGTNCSINGIAMPAYCANTFKSSCQLKQDRNRDGLVIGPFENPYFENNEVQNNFAAYNASYGLVTGWDSTSTDNILHNNTFIHNGIGDPVPRQASWPVPFYDTTTSILGRFSSLANLSIGKIWNSTDTSSQPAVNPAPGPGASLRYRYQMGQLTNQELWPWPMEERIKREFADPSLFQADGVQGRVWTNFSVNQIICQNMLLPQGAVTSCPTASQNTPTPATITPTPTPTPVPPPPTGDPTPTPLPGDGLVSNLIAASGLAYEVVVDGLAVGALQYLDRSFTFSTVPSQLVGLTYIKTANDDKSTIGDNFLSFTVSAPVTLFVAHDDRISPRPSWLSAFSDTGDNLISGGGTFSLFAKEYPQGPVTLGGNEGGGNSMYSLILLPHATPLPGDLDGDGDVDVLDWLKLMGGFNQLNCSLSLLGTCLVDIFDFNRFINLL